MNSAFLSWTAVERLRKDPGGQDLRQIPSIIGGDESKRHGIVTAKSVPAKRFGIKTAMTVAEAVSRCPGLVIARPDFNLYREESTQLMALLRTFSPVQQQLSIDECFLDMTNAALRFQKEPGESSRDWAPRAADAIRKTVKRELGFTVNVGISTNKLLAKMASDFTKPDRTHTLFPEEVRTKMWPLQIGELFGAGPSTAQAMRRMGVSTIGQAAALDADVLRAALGDKAGTYIHEAANGLGSDHVNAQARDAVSMSAETTVPADLGAGDEEQAKEVIQKLSERVAVRLKREKVFAQTITVSVKTEDFKRHSKSVTLPEPIQDAKTMADAAVRGYWQLCGGDSGFFHAGHTVRLIGVGAAKLSTEHFHQMDLFDLSHQIAVSQEKEQERKEKQEKERAAKEAEEKRKRAEEARKKKQEERQAKLQEMQSAVDKKFGAGAIRKGTKK